MEVAFEPFKKVTFRSYLPYHSAEAFVNAIAMGSPAGVQTRTSLFWANGILFRFFNPRPSELLAKEFFEGHLMWDHIEFAPMPTYEREVQGPRDRPLVTIYIIDVSNHVVFEPITKWIQDHLVK